MLVCRLAAPHVQKLTLVSILAMTTGHVVAAHIPLWPAVHSSTVGPWALASCLRGFSGRLQLECSLSVCSIWNNYQVGMFFVAESPLFSSIGKRDAASFPSTDSTEPVDLSEETVEESGWAWVLGKWVVWTVLGFLVLFVLMKLLILWRTRRQMKRFGFFRLPHRPVVVGFFHPYCAAGGGGERVLWHSIRALQKRYSFVRCVVYTGDVDKTPEAILSMVQTRFKLQLRDVDFVFLRRRVWVEARCWPRFTILGQSLGSMLLGLEAVLKLAPHVYMETTGYAFTLPIFRWLGGSRTASYVHYPTVSSDMLESVAKQTHSFNNSRAVSKSRVLTCLKLSYYRLFARLYGFMGRRSDVVMVNSSWTHAHIRQLWSPRQLFIVYPPCDTASFNNLPITRTTRPFRIVSVGQFRPEKNHKSQLRILHQLLEEAEGHSVTLVLVGGCRGAEDEKRVADLQHQAKELRVGHCVEFKINLSFSGLKEELGRAAAAIHTMENEHFGISLVECMAAGCVLVAHESGGPQQDIVVDWEGQPTGFLASTEEHFASCLLHILQMDQREREEIAVRARTAAHTKFSLEVFEASFLRASEKLFG